MALPGKREILFGDFSFTMHSERQRHPIKLIINFWIMIDYLSIPCDVIDESETVHKSIKIICAANSCRPLRPVRDGVKAGLDLFGS